MAVKEFENFEYDFAKQQKQNYQQTIRTAGITFAIIVLLFTCWALVSGINLFPQTSTQINQPIDDPTTKDEEIAKANQDAIDRYANVRIPYNDPQNRFSIQFSTPYLSDEIVVIFNTPNNKAALQTEANNIISAAKQSVEINQVTYIDNF